MSHFFLSGDSNRIRASQFFECVQSTGMTSFSRFCRESPSQEEVGAEKNDSNFVSIER